MTDKELWRQMEELANEKRSLERDMKFMLLLKKAYDKDNMEVEGKRMLVYILWYVMHNQAVLPEIHICLAGLYQEGKGNVI